MIHFTIPKTLQTLKSTICVVLAFSDRDSPSVAPWTNCGSTEISSVHEIRQAEYWSGVAIA